MTSSAGRKAKKSRGSKSTGRRDKSQSKSKGSLGVSEQDESESEPSYTEASESVAPTGGKAMAA